MFKPNITITLVILVPMMASCASDSKNTSAVSGDSSLLSNVTSDAFTAEDRAYAAEKAQHGFEFMRPGIESTWSNPESGNSGIFIPWDSYQNANGFFCRDYEQVIKVAGQELKDKGTACREDDGVWRKPQGT